MVIIVMGVSGCGKTTVGRALAARLGWSFVDADDHHSPANVAKMRRGQPLDDADRSGWLETLRRDVIEPALAGASVVLACSALRQAYRDRLARPDEDIRFVYLHGAPAVIRARLDARRGHYMPAMLLDSQFATLEEPRDALPVSVELSPAEAVDEIIRGLRLD